MRSRVSRLIPVILLAPALVLACGDTTVVNQFFPANATGGDAGETDATPTTPPPPILDANAPEDGSAQDAAIDTCDAGSLACKVVACDAGLTTKLRGKVYDPAGANPLYGVRVYIPSDPDPAALPPIPESVSTPGGITCGACAGVTNALRSTTTNSKGEFVLEDVPVGLDIPIVVQIGKWRRLLTVAVAKACDDNTAPDKSIRLPKNGQEGNLPHIAVTSGEYDALECFVRGVGVDDAEVVEGHATTGHVHMFKGYGGGLGAPVEDFWNDSAQLRKYDAVLLSCEGDEHNENKGTRASMHEYLNAGGRVIATHYHYTWFKNSPATELQQIANWGSNVVFASEFDVDTASADGMAFAEWLYETGASDSFAKLKLAGATNSIMSVNPPAIPWIKAPNSGAKMFSFNTPLSAAPANQCGRALFTDVHVTDKAGPVSIGACGIASGTLNAQQKALEFLFFQLSGC